MFRGEHAVSQFFVSPSRDTLGGVGFLSWTPRTGNGFYLARWPEGQEGQPCWQVEYLLATTLPVAHIHHSRSYVSLNQDT